jgi:oligo-alginate lyase
MHPIGRPWFRRAIAFFIIGVLLGALTNLTVAASYPKPAPAQAFPEYKIYDEHGHPWRTAMEDWEGARHRVKSDARWAEWLAGEQRSLERWMSKPRDRVEWAAGWSHDGVSPKDASRVIWTEAVPGEEVDHFRSATDPRIEITPKLFAWWVVGVRGRNVDHMVTAARLYRLTGDERFAAWASGQMDFYADNFLKWAPARGGARLFWQTLTEATHLIKFAETVRLLGDYVSEPHRQHWKTRFFDPEVQVLNSTYQNIHNIACWQRAAVAQVALLFGDEPLWKEAIEGPRGIRAQLREGVTSDYLWHEQSFGYNGYVVRALNTLFVTAGLYRRAHVLADEMAIAENLMLSTTYYRFPDGKLPNPADSSGIGTAPDVRTWRTLYRVFPTPPGLRAAQSDRDWDTLLDPPAETTRDVPAPEVVSRNLESTRMAILRQGGWQVFFHYGQLTRTHSQAEALNYSAAYGTTDVTHDAGTAGYGSPLHRGYFTRGLAHNTLLVDGEGQDLGAFDERREWLVEQPDPQSPTRGELQEFSSQPARVSAAQPNYRKNARAQRRLEIDDQRLIDRATIETTDGASHRLGWVLHLQGMVILPADFSPDPAFTNDRPEPFRYWEKPKRAKYRDSVVLEALCGQTRFKITVLCDGEFSIWHASSPDVPPTKRQSVYIETVGRSATFTTVFTPSEQTAP